MAANLKLLLPWIKPDSGPYTFDCIVYIYTARTDQLFWSMPELTSVSSLCEVVEVPGQRFAQNLFMAQPALMSHLRFVFVLLDDILLSSDFSLSRLIDVMANNHLTVASPRIQGANTGGGQRFRLIMQALPVNGTLGYRTCFLEIFACLFTREAYRALWSLISLENPFGWGYDLWYDGFARRRVQGHAMGIVSIFSASHIQNTGGIFRTDNVSDKEKWQAVVNQEKHFEKYLNIPLRTYRRKMRIRGKGWDGAVVGYLE